MATPNVYVLYSSEDLFFLICSAFPIQALVWGPHYAGWATMRFGASSASNSVPAIGSFLLISSVCACRSLRLPNTPHCPRLQRPDCDSPRSNLQIDGRWGQKLRRNRRKNGNEVRRTWAVEGFCEHLADGVQRWLDAQLEDGHALSDAPQSPAGSEANIGLTCDAMFRGPNLDGPLED